MNFFKKYFNSWDRLCAVIVVLLGTFNHFLYHLSGELAVTALFCPVNESIWEHLKLLFFPFLLVTVWTYLRYHPYLLPFFFTRFLGVLGGMLLIVTCYYTYSGILGHGFLIADLIIYALGVSASFLISYRLYNSCLKYPSASAIFCLWLAAALCFFIFTCCPPNLPLFFPPDIV